MLGKRTAFSVKTGPFLSTQDFILIVSFLLQRKSWITWISIYLKFTCVILQQNSRVVSFRATMILKNSTGRKAVVQHCIHFNITPHAPSTLRLREQYSFFFFKKIFTGDCIHEAGDLPARRTRSSYRYDS